MIPTSMTIPIGTIQIALGAGGFIYKICMDVRTSRRRHPIERQLEDMNDKLEKLKTSID